jgi:predicted dehydrogenase
VRSIKRARRPENTEPIGVAVIGCGYWGRNHVRVLGELRGATVVAACDESVERLETVGAAFPHVHLTTDVDEALSRPGVQAAIVCTPASDHFALARTCLERGVHTLVEKPMTTSSADADALMRLSARADATLMTGHTFVFNAGVRKMKEYVDREDLGRIYCLYARRTSLGPIRSDVNALWDLAPHDISIFDYLLNAMPEQVSAIGSCLLCDDREDFGFITLVYPRDIIAHIHVSWADPHKTREVVVVGSEKRAVFNDLDPLERVRVFDKGVRRVVPEAPTYGEFAFLLREGDIVSPMIEASEPLKNECEHFLDCVRTGRQPLTDGRAGRDVVRVMEAIDRSLELHGQPVATTVDEVPGDDRTKPAPVASAAR